MGNQLRTYIGKPLDGFTVEEYIEIVQLNKDNKKVSSHGYLKDESLAQAFLELNDDLPCWHPADREHLGTDKVLVLTNGARTFLLGSTEEIQILPENETRAALQHKAKEKMSPTLRKLLTI